MSATRYSDISDNELLQRYLQTHNNEWLGILLQRYTLLLLGVCMKYLKDENEAQDAVQQVFLKVIQEVHKYKIDYFKSWLYMVAKNHCLTALRDKKGRIPETLTDNHNSILPEESDNDTPLSVQVTPELLGGALEELREEQKQCVTLFHLQKKSYAEISDSTGFSLMKVKSYIQNGKRNLKLIIEKKLKQSVPKNG